MLSNTRLISRVIFAYCVVMEFVWVCWMKLNIENHEVFLTQSKILPFFETTELRAAMVYDRDCIW